jgi:hypothetical protein
VVEARRALLIFRLVVYPASLALIVWLLFLRGDDTSSVALHGTTSQDRPIALTIDDTAVTLEGRLEASCAGLRPGPRWYSAWATGERDGERVLIRARTTRDHGGGWTSARSYTVRGTLDGEAVRGSISLAETWDGGREGRTRCSGDVTFTAQR